MSVDSVCSRPCRHRPVTVLGSPGPGRPRRRPGQCVTPPVFAVLSEPFTNTPRGGCFTGLTSESDGAPVERSDGASGCSRSPQLRVGSGLPGLLLPWGGLQAAKLRAPQEADGVKPASGLQRDPGTLRGIPVLWGACPRRRRLCPFVRPFWRAGCLGSSALGRCTRPDILQGKDLGLVFRLRTQLAQQGAPGCPAARGDDEP